MPTRFQPDGKTARPAVLQPSLVRYRMLPALPNGKAYLYTLFLRDAHAGGAPFFPVNPGQVPGCSSQHANGRQRQRVSHQLYGEFKQGLSTLKLDLDWLHGNVSGSSQVKIRLWVDDNRLEIKLQDYGIDMPPAAGTGSVALCWWRCRNAFILLKMR